MCFDSRKSIKMHLPAPDTLACSPRKLHSWIWEAERTGEGRGGKWLRKGSGEGNEGEIEGEEREGQTSPEQKFWLRHCLYPSSLTAHNVLQSASDSVTPFVTNLYLEASSSSTSIQDGFHLLLPVVQLALLKAEPVCRKSLTSSAADQ